MATYISGTDGYISVGSSLDAAGLSKWSLSYGAENSKFFTRSGSGSQVTVKSSNVGSGSIELVYDDDDPPSANWTSGDLVTLSLYMNAGNVFTGQARLGTFDYEVDIEGSENRCTIAFDTHGAWTSPST